MARNVAASPPLSGCAVSTRRKYTFLMQENSTVMDSLPCTSSRLTPRVVRQAKMALVAAMIGECGKGWGVLREAKVRGNSASASKWPFEFSENFDSEKVCRKVCAVARLRERSRTYYY
jgi:hypothetical protein